MKLSGRFAGADDTSLAGLVTGAGNFELEATGGGVDKCVAADCACGASTGICTVGTNDTCSEWLKRQFGRSHRGLSGHGSLWNNPSVENMLAAGDRKKE